MTECRFSRSESASSHLMPIITITHEIMRRRTSHGGPLLFYCEWVQKISRDAGILGEGSLRPGDDLRAGWVSESMLAAHLGIPCRIKSMGRSSSSGSSSTAEDVQDTSQRVTITREWGNEGERDRCPLAHHSTSHPRFGPAQRWLCAEGGCALLRCARIAFCTTGNAVQLGGCAD
jgi:hypothetical protein